MIDGFGALTYIFVDLGITYHIAGRQVIASIDFREGFGVEYPASKLDTLTQNPKVIIVGQITGIDQGCAARIVIGQANPSTAFRS